MIDSANSAITNYTNGNCKRCLFFRETATKAVLNDKDYRNGIEACNRSAAKTADDKVSKKPNKYLGNAAKTVK